MTQILQQFEPGKEIASGLFPGLDLSAVPLWAEGENVVFKKGGVQSVKGLTPLQTVGEEIRALSQTMGNNGPRLYIAGKQKIWLKDYSTGYEYLGQLPQIGETVFETWGKWLVITNNRDNLRIWKNGGAMTLLGGVPFSRAKFIMRHKVYLLAFNTSNGEEMIEWSSDSAPEDWTPSAENSAGNYFVRDLDSGLVGALPLGGGIAAYSKNSLVYGQWLGLPAVYGWNIVLSGIGLIGPKAGCAAMAANYGMSRNGIWRTDGASYEYIGSIAQQDWLEEIVDWNKGEQISAAYDRALQLVLFTFPSVDGQWRQVGVNIQTGAFTNWQLPITAIKEGTTYDQTIIAEAGTAGLLGISGDRDARVRTKPLALGDGNRFKYIDYIKVGGSWTPGTKIRLGHCTDPNSFDGLEWFHEGDLDTHNYLPGREVVYLVLEFDGGFTVNNLGIGGEAGGYVV